MRARHTKAKFEDEETKATWAKETNTRNDKRTNRAQRQWSGETCKGLSNVHIVLETALGHVQVNSDDQAPNTETNDGVRKDQSERTKRTRIVDASTLRNARPRCGIVLRDVHEAVPNDRAGNVDRDA